MGEHHALGRAFRAGGEQDRCRIVRLARHSRRRLAQQAEQLVLEADRGPQIVEPDDVDRAADLLHHRPELCLLDESARGQHGPHLGRLAGRQDVRRTGGEVDHRRHLAGRHDAEQRRAGAVGVGQHDAQRLLSRIEMLELLAEHCGGGQQLAVAQRTRDRILHGKLLQAALIGRLDDLLKHGLADVLGAEDEVRHHLIERGTRRGAPLAPLQFLRDFELHWFQDGHLDLREQAAAHMLRGEPREVALLQPFDAHRHHHRAGLVGDHGGAVIDLHEAAGDRDAAFREDDQRIAALHDLDQRAGRHRLRRIERQRAGKLHERLHPPGLGDGIVDREDRLLVGQRQRQRAVEEADMVERQDRRLAGRLEVVQPLDLQPQEGAEQDRDEIAERIGRQVFQHQPGGDGVGDDEAEQDARDGDAGGLDGRDEGAADGHEAGIDDAHRRDDAGAARLRRPGLHGGEGRHHQEGGGNGHAGEVDGDTDGVRAGEEGGKRLGLRRRLHAPDGPGQMQAEQRHQRGADRRGQKHHASLRHPGGDGRADGDRDGEHRKISGDRDLVATERILDHRRQDRKHDRADQPEPRGHQAGAPDAHVGAQFGDLPPGRAEDVLVDGKVGCRRTGGRDVAAGQPAADGQRHHDRPEHRDADAVGGNDAPGDGAAEDRREGGRLDPGIGLGQFLALEMIGQDAVFDRSEQRRDDAEHQERRHQHRDRGQRDADDGEAGRGDLGEFQPTCDERLVEAVGDLAAQRRKQQEGGHEDGAGQRHQRRGLILRQGEENEEHQRVLQEIVVEGREELRPEERREAPRHHQMGVHGNFHWASPAGNPIGLSGRLRGLSLVYREAVKLRYCDSTQSICFLFSAPGICRP
ncbi:hypothetical protein MPL1032_390012 [Mesorhizobium plurifarium]|uniref:Uncharacterized protein n=1 Tax=Mesorhizobium plurifarium TaxID=69974 RepID=A0A0K2W4K1_MESPL|nr:hypothetical protein MPL1032_390012 [Mesorhizobium plurifarium]